MNFTPDLDVSDGAAAPTGDVDMSGGGVAQPVGEALLAQVRTARAALLGLPGLLSRIGSDELPELAAAAAGAVAAACAAQAAVVLEAEDRGVIAESDHPRVPAWVQQSHVEAGVPVSPGRARALGVLARICDRQDAAPLREAVLDGRVTVEAAELLAATYRRLQGSITVKSWDGVMDALIGLAAHGVNRRELAAMEEQLIGQYGTEGEYEERERRYERRDFTELTLNPRTGMYEGRVRLDAASAAVVIAAINALSKPRPTKPDTTGTDEAPAAGTASSGGLGGATGATDATSAADAGRFDAEAEALDAAVTGRTEPDLRTAGERRADALVALAAHAAVPDKATPGTGAKAKVVVTIKLADLVAGLESEALPGMFADLVRKHRERTGGTGVRTDHNHGCGTTAFGHMLTPSQVRVLSCDAQIIPAVLGTGSEPLDLGRGKRLISPGLATYLAMRDGGCTFPGCSMPPAWCDGHHLISWLMGGPTDRHNTALLCRHHHTVVHRYDFVGVVIEGHVQWSRADGTPIGNRPRAG
ncbi:HNH endonuclease signature motif containing protein [Piscicoccus intestinalis]|uniref:HNH endonuclease signature motif containing protein n=1 Tax=Piscicoccus intestinalis TaxID=746033 RepID=UPI0008380406|nr:HNH endonuclease signature motif containing protein [Piscicoccus intestinalis]